MFSFHSSPGFVLHSRDYLLRFRSINLIKVMNYLQGNFSPPPPPHTHTAVGFFFSGVSLNLLSDFELLDNLIPNCKTLANSFSNDYCRVGGVALNLLPTRRFVSDVYFLPYIFPKTVWLSFTCVCNFFLFPFSPPHKHFQHLMLQAFYKLKHTYNVSMPVRPRLQTIIISRRHDPICLQKTSLTY